jgi:hypothetical protein
LPESSPSLERYSLAVITDDDDIFPEIRKYLGGEFRTSLATTEDEIRAVIDRDDVHAILFSLDAIGEGPGGAWPFTARMPPSRGHAA